jgi:hypothetical protein
MPSTRLYIDPQAQAVTTKAAASAEASLMQSAATAPAEQARSAAAAATAHAFDVAAAAAMVWACGGHEGIVATVSARGAAAGAVSAAAFNTLDAMNETNAVDLRTVAEQL